MPYTLNSYSAVRPLFLNKSGKKILLVLMMRFWGGSILMQNDLVACGYKWLHAQSSCPSSPGSPFCVMTKGAPSLEEMNQVMRWMRIWPYIGFSSSSPSPILSRVITESVAGSTQQKGHRYLKQKEHDMPCQQVIWTFSLHSSPNTHPRWDEKRSEQPCFTLRENWAAQGLDAFSISPRIWEAGVT